MSEKDEKNMEKINDLIRDISKGAAFSADAMAQFVDLQSEVDSQESTIKYLRGENKKRDEDVKARDGHIASLEGDKAELQAELAGWKTRQGELLDREQQITRLEMTAAYEEKRREDHQVMVGLVFRNVEVRKSVLGTELSHQPGHPEIKDEYGNIRQYHEDAGFVGTPVKKDEIETKE